MRPRAPDSKQQQADQVNQLLALFYALLVLAVVIAFLGIVNTLALSVLERVRELGLLRAIGMTRRQLPRRQRCSPRSCRAGAPPAPICSGRSPPSDRPRAPAVATIGPSDRDLGHGP